MPLKFSKINPKKPNSKVIKEVAFVFKKCFPTQKKQRIDYLVRMIRREIKQGQHYIAAEERGKTAGLEGLQTARLGGQTPFLFNLNLDFLANGYLVIDVSYFGP